MNCESSSLGSTPSQIYIPCKFEELPDILHPLDLMHTEMSFTVQKVPLDIVLKDILTILENNYFCNETKLGELEISVLFKTLSYIQYILNYQLFMNKNPRDVPFDGKFILDNIKEKVYLIEKEILKSGKCWQPHVEKRKTNILWVIKTFGKLLEIKFKSETLLGSSDFPKFHKNVDLNDTLHDLYSIVHAPLVEFNFRYDALLFKEFCKRLDQIRNLEPPIHILDLVLSIASFYCGTKRKYFQKEICDGGYFICQWFMQWNALASKQLLDMADSEHISNVHRYERIKEIAAKTSKLFDYKSISDNLIHLEKLEFPHFERPPKPGEEKSDFWRNLKKTLDFDFIGDFYCSVCGVAEINEESAILESCNHTFCKNCIDLWFNVNNRCPLCSRIVYRWTVWKYAKLYTEKQDYKFPSCFWDLVGYVRRQLDV